MQEIVNTRGVNLLKCGLAKSNDKSVNFINNNLCFFKLNTVLQSPSLPIDRNTCNDRNVKVKFG